MKHLTLILSLLSLLLFSNCKKEEKQFAGFIYYNVECSPAGINIMYNDGHQIQTMDYEGYEWQKEVHMNIGDQAEFTVTSKHPNATIRASMWLGDSLLCTDTISGDYPRIRCYELIR